MPISAIGTPDPSTAFGRKGFAQQGFTLSRRFAQQGFTLIELLIVLTIFGLMSAVVVLALPDPEGSLFGEARKFAARAHAAQEKAVMDNRAVALRLTPEGYGFDDRRQGQWQAIERAPFVTTNWKQGTLAVLEGGSGRIIFDSTGYAEPARLVLARGGERAVIDISDGGVIHVGP